MIILGEFFHKAINEGFQVELQVNGEFAGVVVKQDDIYRCVKNGRFMAVERIFKDSLSFANNVMISKNKIVVKG